MIASDASLARLMGLAQQGDAGAYRVLLVESQRWLIRYFAGRIAPAQVDDLVQETLLSLHAKRASFDAARPFLPWLAAIARYRWVDALRRSYRLSETELPEDLAGDGSVLEVPARIALGRLLDQLPRGQSQAIQLVKIEGHSIDEAAAISGQSGSLVKVNIHRGLKKLASLCESE
jgi:RNA polymerase sigma factor (sigma-70 family)